MNVSRTDTAFVFSPRCVEHDTGHHHPERPDRLRAIARAVRLAGLITSPDPFPDFRIEFGDGLLKAPHPLIELAPTPAEEKWVHLCHTSRMIEQLRHTCSWGDVLDDSETMASPATFEIALLSLGSALTACDFVMTGAGRRAFSAARPPGHHAESFRAMGFCLFNNAAIAARYLQQKYGVTRVAIVDFDVHHGNGTQEIFERDPSVLYISIHEDPFTCYPGTGHEVERGKDAGVGSTLNCPMHSGATDEHYEAAFDEKIVPALDAFAPEVLILSSGFDAHASDPLANVCLSDEAYTMMTQKLVDVANRHCGGRVVSLLEGGYELHALGRCLVRHLIALSA